MLQGRRVRWVPSLRANAATVSARRWKDTAPNNIEVLDTVDPEVGIHRTARWVGPHSTGPHSMSGREYRPQPDVRDGDSVKESSQRTSEANAIERVSRSRSRK